MSTRIRFDAAGIGVVAVACMVASCGSATLRTDGGAIGGSDGGEAGVRDGGAAALAITSPPSPTFTNRSVSIQVTVTGAGAANSVQLLENGTALATLNAPPYAFTWDTTKEAEGSYQIVAQIVLSGQIVASAPVTIVVDRTAPTIVSSVPASGATNVSLTDPINVVFSEALAPTSVTAGVELALGTVVVSTTDSLGADGKTINVAVANRSSLALPGAMTESVAPTITDLAGNAFAGASWNVSVPLWVDMGTLNGGQAQMTLNVSDVPVIAIGNGPLQIATYSGGTSWDTTSIPTPLTAGESAAPFPALAVGKSGDLYVGWVDQLSTSSAVAVARWTGSAWDRSYGNVGAGSGSLAIALTSAEEPIVGWFPTTGTSGNPEQVSIWNGSAWAEFAGTPAGYLCESQPCRLLVDQSNFPIIEVGGQITRWTGSSWTSPQGAGLTGLALNSAQQAISVLDTTTTLQVVPLSTTGTLTNYVPLLTSAADSVSPDDTPQTAVDSMDEPIIVWGEHLASGQGQIHVARWTGAVWDQAYGVLTPAQGKADIVLAQGTIPIVAWEDNTSAAGLTTHVAKSNH